MKKITFLLSFILCSFSFGQIESFESEYIEMIKRGVQEESRMIVSENLTLTEEQADELNGELAETANATFAALDRIKEIRTSLMAGLAE